CATWTSLILWCSQRHALVPGKPGANRISVLDRPVGRAGSGGLQYRIYGKQCGVLSRRGTGAGGGDSGWPKTGAEPAGIGGAYGMDWVWAGVDLHVCDVGLVCAGAGTFYRVICHPGFGRASGSYWDINGDLAAVCRLLFAF